MKRFRLSYGAVLFLVISFALIIIWGVFPFPTQAAEPPNPSQPLAPFLQGVDLSNVTLSLADLPSGFEEMPESLLSNFRSLLEQVNKAGGFSNAGMVNLVGYQRIKSPYSEFVVSFLLTPLNPIQTVLFDRQLSNPDQFIKTTEKALSASGFSQFAVIPGSTDLGTSSIGFSAKVAAGVVTIEEDVLSLRRKNVNAQIAIYYSEGYQPTADILTLGRTLDTRLEAAVGPEIEIGIGEPFRAAGPLVPEITTYIPTPLNLSPKPSVIGTNLLLAALMMLPFAVAAEFFTRTLAENEETLRRRFRPLNWVIRMQERMAGFSKSRFGDVLKVFGVMLFYGLVFSLLDKTWKPFSLKGLVLFGSMTIAYGLVGVADDILQWQRIRRWGLPAELKVRPSNILLAAMSMATTRILSLVPGLMFGTPEALETDEKQFDEPKRNTLLKISAVTFTVIGLIVWLPTIVTDVLQRINLLSSDVNNLLGGLEAILLVIFAVALENLFIQMLGFPGSFGHSLKRKSRWLWVGLLVLVTFVFYHTLINPRGELAAALEEGNVLLFLGVVAAFVLFTFGMRLFFRIRNGRLASTTTLPLLSTSAPVALSQAASPLTAAVPVTAAEKAPVTVSVGGEKQCPICGNTIKAEANLCRFCRTTFTVTIKGYCLTDHAVVEVNGAGICIHCGGEPADLHVESRLLQAPPVRPARAVADKATAQTPGTATEPVSETKPCPACGQTIKAEAKICRFCRARFQVTLRGYCTNCHAVTEVADNRCVKCGNPIQDIQIETKLVGASPPSASAHSPTSAPQAALPAVKKPEPAPEKPGPQKCPKCSGDLSEQSGSPISPYINTYTCSRCGWGGFKCGETGCDGYLKPQEAGYPNSVRYNCVKCGWTGMGPRVRL